MKISLWGKERGIWKREDIRNCEVNRVHNVPEAAKQSQAQSGFSGY